jgi:hypothetical protein
MSADNVSLINFNQLNLKKKSIEKSFDEFKKYLLDKKLIAITNDLCKALEKYNLNIKPRILLSMYIINQYPTELLGEMKEWQEIDTELYQICQNTVDIIESEKKLENIYKVLNIYMEKFIVWTNFDKDRSIEQLIISYYNRMTHINKMLTSNNKIEFEQEQDMMIELEKQKSELLRMMVTIDPTFNATYFKENYIQVYNDIMKARNEMSIRVKNVMKKAYYDMLCEDIKKGDMMSCFNQIKEIGKRLSVMCPKNMVTSFEQKFSDDNLTTILLSQEFTPEIKSFIKFMVDFTILIDAPINDENNQIWSNEINSLVCNKFCYNFPKILIQISEHIDTVVDMILALDSQVKNNKN